MTRVGSESEYSIGKGGRSILQSTEETLEAARGEACQEELRLCSGGELNDKSFKAITPRYKFLLAFSLTYVTFLYEM